MFGILFAVLEKYIILRSVLSVCLLVGFLDYRQPQTGKIIADLKTIKIYMIKY